MKLKEYYKGRYPCDSCIHNKVCNVKHCFEETEFKTTHPYVDIVVRCTEYRYSKTKKRECMAESEEQEEIDDYRDRLDELEREEYYESKYGKEQE